MNTNFIFEIKENVAGQRILLVDDQFRFENHEPVAREDFDAILYCSSFSSLVEFQIMWLNPLVRYDFQYKPFFLNPKITHNTILAACDGLYTSIDDPGLISEVSRIYNRMEEINFQVVRYGAEFWNSSNILLSVLRFYLLRGDDMPAPILKRGSFLGYMLPILELMFKHGFIQPFELIRFREDMLRSYRYLEVTELVNVVHLDPKCYSSHLIYSESCPKCSSFDVYQEEMIHHFRCANISPESTYNRGGKLVCPKCSKEVRHIGVDYDRPTGVYSCNKCSLAFTVPIMSSTCVSCGNQTEIEKLVPHKIVHLCFTRQGRRVLASSNAYVHEDNMPLYENTISYVDFTKLVRTRIEVYQRLQKKEWLVQVVRIRCDFTKESADAVVHQIYDDRPLVLIAFRKSVMYAISEMRSIEDLEADLRRREEILVANGVKNPQLDYLEYSLEVSVDDFIAQL